jgi:hypothetical protein
LTLRVSRGALVEYGFTVPPLVLMFELNPESISSTRTITVKTGTAPGTRGGYDFVLPKRHASRRESTCSPRA